MSISLPSLIVQELAILMTPPAAIFFIRRFRKGLTSFCSASSSSKQSTSMHATYLLVLMFRPIFKASAFPPFCLSTMINFSKAGFVDLKILHVMAGLEFDC
jgi:ABC-type sulfate transport system permease subunit